MDIQVEKQDLIPGNNLRIKERSCSWRETVLAYSYTGTFYSAFQIFCAT